MIELSKRNKEQKKEGESVSGLGWVTVSRYANQSVLDGKAQRVILTSLIGLHGEVTALGG